MGYNHVASGLCAGIATVPVAPVSGWASSVAWVVALGGCSLLPDLDTAGSSAARMWGPPTRLLGAAIGAAAGGHRRGTHDAILAPLGAAAVVVVAGLHPVTTGLVLALTIGLSLRGLALLGGNRIGAAVNLLASAAGAWWLLAGGAGHVDALPLVAAAGVLVHIVGDVLTSEGVPVPVAHLLGNRRRLRLALFTVNSRTERRLVAPALSLLGVALLWAHLGLPDLDALVR